ncbi:hypothetical protein [Aliikangiella maris]|uniref:Uncharacterized protein n=2 Tax=Aliikangiella maris TaxID=3162458 RepID=A0ABV3MSE6_9GAMM
MKSLFGIINLLVLRRPAVILLFTVSIFLQGLWTQYAYQKFLYLQSQNLDQISVFNEIIIPLAGITLVFQWLLSLVVCIQFYPNFSSANQQSLLILSAVSRKKLLTIFARILNWVGGLPLLVFTLITFLFYLSSALDLARVVFVVVALALIQLTINWFLLSISLLVVKPLITFLVGCLFIIMLVTAELSMRLFSLDSIWQGIILPYFSFREGLLTYADLIGYLGWNILGWFFCLGLLNSWSTKQGVLRNYYSGIVLGILLVFSALLVPGKIDFTHDHRNTLSSDIVSQLKQYQEPLQIVAVIDDETSREQIIRGFNMIRSWLPQSQLTFQSRQALSPEQQHTGEYLAFHLGELHQLVAYPFTQDVKRVFQGALIQMLNRKSQWITFVEGHGEASLFANKSSDLGQLYGLLKDAGWSSAAINFAKTPIISENTSLLIIPASRQQWLPAEEKLLTEYLERGGNLLLLVDPESYFPVAIQQKIPVTRFLGTLVDWNGFQNGTPHPAVVIVNQFSQHPVVSHINSLLAFPWSAGLKLNTQLLQQTKDWNIEPIITTHSGVWNELDIQKEELVYNAQSGEQQQVFVLAYSFTNNKNKQKIVVVGDSHFLSDTAINNYANKQFSLNLISWLTNIEQTDVQALPVEDRYVEPSSWLNWSLLWGTMLFLPLSILFIGFKFFWKP